MTTSPLLINKPETRVKMSENKETIELENIISKLPEHLVIQKCLWVGNDCIEINHIDNDVDKQLDYLGAFKKMAKKLNVVI